MRQKKNKDENIRDLVDRDADSHVIAARIVHNAKADAKCQESSLDESIDWRISAVTRLSVILKIDTGRAAALMSEFCTDSIGLKKCN